MTDIPAGWYDDPEYPTHHRYWDGVQWTEHRAPKVPPSGRSASAWQIVPDSFSLLGRCWRELVVIVLPAALLLVVGVIVLYLAFDAALSPGFGEILDRITDPGFDPDNNRADDRFINSIEFNLGAAGIVGWVVGGIALLFGTILVAVSMFIHLASVNAGYPLPPAETHRQTLRRIPRIVGIYVLWGLGASVGTVSVLVVAVLLAWVSPLTLILIFPAAIAAIIFLWPFGHIAFTMLVLAPRGTPPLRGAVALVRHRWAPIAGRIVALNVVLIAVSIGLNIVGTPLGLASIWAGILGGILFQVIQYAISMSGSVVIYDWADGPLDPALRGEERT